MPASEAFKAALRNSHTAISKVTLRRGSQILVDDLSVVAGEVTDDAAAQVRRRCSLMLPGISSVLALLPQAQPSDGGLWPLGNELLLQSGIRYPAKFAGSYKVYNNYVALSNAANSSVTSAQSTSNLRGLVLPGTAGHNSFTPDHASLDITGDIDIRVRVALADWTPATTQVLVSKFDTINPNTSGAYHFVVNATTGTIRLRWSTGAANISIDSTVAPTVTDGMPKWIRATLDVNNGAGGNDVTFYTSDDGVNWVQLGNVVTTAGVTSMATNNGSLVFGSDIFGNNMITGVLTRVQIFNGIGGTAALNVDYTSTAQGWTIGETTGGTGVDATGKTITIQGANTFIRSAQQIPGDIDVRVIDVAATDWSTGANQVMFSKWNDILENNRGWGFDVGPTGLLQFFHSTNGTDSPNVVSTATVYSVGAVDGSPMSFRVTLDVDNGAAGRTVTFYYSTDSGNTWTVLGAPVVTAGVTSINLSTRELAIGTRSGGIARFIGRIGRVEYRDGIGGPVVASADFRSMAAGTTSFTDAQGQPWNVISPAAITESSTTITVGTGTPQIDELVSMGVFRISKPVINDTGPDLTVSVEGFDRSRSVSRAGFTQPYVINIGTNYADAIKALIQARAPWLAPTDFSFMTTTYQTPQLVFTESEDPWDMATKMAASIGAELFFNGDGVCVLQPQPDPQFTPSSFDYVEGEDATFTAITRDLDDQEAYNGVVIISENSDIAVPIRAEKWDTNPLSPTYYDPAAPGASIYGPVPKIITSQYITTQAQADDAATAEFTRITGVIEKIDLTAVNNPSHFSGDVIKVTRSRINVDSLYLLESLKIGLGANASMSGTTRRRRAA